MSRYIGNYLRVPSLEPQQANAPGIWSISEQLAYQRANLWPPARDPYYNQTVLHLSGDVAATRETNPVTQPRTFLSDASSNNFLLTPNGDVSARPFSPYSNNYSNYFNGSSSVNFANNAGFDFSTGDFTIESWVYIAGNSPLDGSSRRYASIFSVATTNNYNVSFIVRGDSTTTGTGLEIYNGTSAIAVTGSISQNAWNHVAVSRSGANAYFWLNGQQMGAAQSISGSWGSSANPGQVGQSSHTYSYSFPLIGYLSNVRVVKGRAVYTSAFTPSTTPLTRTSGGTNPPQGTECVLLTCQSNRFLDSNGPNVPASSPLTTTVTGSPVVAQNSPFVEYDTTSGSGYFDGSDYLIAPDNTAFDFSTPSGTTNDFTLEAWIYPVAFNTAAGIMGGYNDAAQTGYRLVLDSNGSLRVNIASFNLASAASTVSLNQWQHVVLTRTSNNVYIYHNGTQVASGTTSNAADAPSNFLIGRNTVDVNNWYFSGYISNVRVIKGTGVTSVTIPTAPLTPVSGTQLLTLQTRAPANNQGIVDTSPNNLVVTRTGNVAQGSFSPFSAGGYSVSTTATNTLDLPGSVLAFGSSSFTVEAWVYATHVSGAPIVYPYNSGNAATSGGFSVSFGTGGVGYYAVNGATPINYVATIPINTWYHLALVKDGTAARLYLNGQLVATGTDSTTYTTPTGGARVGGIYNLTQTYGLVVNNLRIVTGQALYNANFTPATTNLTASVIGHQGLENTPITGTVRILTARDPYRIDRSSNNHTIGSSGSPQFLPISPFAPTQAYVASQLGGSGYFDGNGDYLTAPNNTAFDFGSGDLTIEAWIFPTANSGVYDSEVISYGQTGTLNGWHFGLTGSGTVNRLQIGLNYSGYLLTSTGVVPLNAWSHVAATRSGTTWRLFINGVQDGTTTSSTNPTVSGSSLCYIGTASYDPGATNRSLTGYISNPRVLKGTALYTGAFTPPTAPLTAILNTSLLLNFTNGGIVDATGKNNLETVANSGVQTTQAKWSPGSMYFNGTTDYIQGPRNTLIDLGSGDFTIELWAYITSTTVKSIINLTNKTAYPGLLLKGNDTSLQLLVASGDASWAVNLNVTSLSSVLNTWAYIAAVRSGNVFTLYRNGTSVGTTTVSMTVESNLQPVIGVAIDSVGLSDYFSGYMQDVRITRYARTITASPTRPFPLA